MKTLIETAPGFVARSNYKMRANFFRYLIRLLEFGREREGVDQSDVVLTHHKLTKQNAMTKAANTEEVKGKEGKVPGFRIRQ